MDEVKIILKGSSVLSKLINMHPYDHDFVYSKLSHKTRMYESILLAWEQEEGSSRYIRIVSLCRGIVMVLVVLLARRVSVQISELLTSLSLAT